MPFSFLTSPNTGASSASSVSTGPNNFTGAGLIVVTIQSLGTSGLTFAVSDTQGNVWTPTATTTQGTLLQRSWYCISPSVSNTQNFTVTSSAPMPKCSLYAAGFSGKGLFQVRTSGSGASTTAHTGAETPNSSGSLCYAVGCANGGSAGISIDSGFNQISNGFGGSGIGIANAYLIQGSPASVNPLYTFPGASGVIAEMLVFNLLSLEVTSGTIASFDAVSITGQFQTSVQSGSITSTDSVLIRQKFAVSVTSGSITTSTAVSVSGTTEIASGDIVTGATVSVSGGALALLSGSIVSTDSVVVAGVGPISILSGTIISVDSVVVVSSDAPLSVSSGSISTFDSVLASNITIACPVSNTANIGVPYSGQVIAAGTAPLSFSISSGILPPGLTLNPTTGAITGVPVTSGTFPYQVKVTDGSGLAIKATCSYVIAGSQASSPCDSVVQNPETDSYFELRKMCVWVKTNKRLPVRGRG